MLLTQKDVDARIESWNAAKPTLYVLLSKSKGGEWDNDNLGDITFADSIADLQEVVNDLCRNVRDFRDCTFAAAEHDGRGPHGWQITERLYDENEYDDDGIVVPQED